MQPAEFKRISAIAVCGARGGKGDVDKCLLIKRRLLDDSYRGLMVEIEILLIKVQKRGDKSWQAEAPCSLL